MIYLFVCIVVLFLVHKQFGLYNILNPFVAFTYFYIGFLFISLSWLDNLTRNKGVSIEPETERVIIVFLAMFMISGLLISLFFKKYPFYRRLDFREIRLFKLQNENILSAVILYFLGLFFWLIFIIKSGGQIPFLADDIENFRIEARKGAGGITIISTLLLTYSGAILSISKRLIGLYKLLLIGVTFFMILSFGNRGPAIMFLLVVFIIYVIHKRIKVRMIFPILVGSALYFLIVLLGAYRMNVKADLWTKVGLTIGWRPFVNIQNLDLLLTKYDNFLYGYGYWIDLYVLMPGYSPNLGTWLKEYLGLSFDGGSITATVIGEAFVNFGYWGVYLYPAMVALLLISFALVQSQVLYKNDGFLSTGQLVFFLLTNIGLAGIVSSGITSVMLYVVIPIYGIYFLDKALVNQFKKFGVINIEE